MNNKLNSNNAGYHSVQNICLPAYHLKTQKLDYTQTKIVPHIFPDTPSIAGIKCPQVRHYSSLLHLLQIITN
jgi:hypothetical protein